jgi:diguanylate cyclase (GGDEF)-like protein
MAEAATDKVARENWDLITESLDRLSEGMTIIDADDKLVLYNTQAAEYLGIEIEDIGVGISLKDLVHAKEGDTSSDPGALLMQQLDVSRTGKPQFFEREIGDGRILSVRANPIPAGGVITLYTDITERKAFEKRLIDMATRDKLTGLINRREFFTIAAHEEERAKREGHVVSVMMLDADYFKKINDTYGHAAGDDVLRDLAANCRKIFRKTDVVGRYGGEEFAVMLPGAEERMAKVIAERIRSSIEQSTVMVDDEEISYTVSIGIACAIGKDVRIEELLDRADRALYTAKAEGRNRAVFDIAA